MLSLLFVQRGLGKKMSMLPDDMVLSESYIATYIPCRDRLRKQLRDEFPGKDIPRVPSKNKAPTVLSGFRTAVSAVLDTNEGESSETSGRSSPESFSSATIESPPVSSPASPGLPVPAVGSPLDDLSRHRSRSSPTLHKQATSYDYQVPREKNRLTLRAFLRQIVNDKRLLRSNSLLQFLLSDPITKFTKEEEADIGRRLQMDQLRLAEQEQFVVESRKRARELDQWLKEFKHDLIANRIPCSVQSS